MFSSIFEFLIFLKNLQSPEPEIKEPIVSDGPILYQTNINTISPLSNRLFYFDNTKYIQFIVNFRNKETLKKYQRSFSKNNTNPNTKVSLQLKCFYKEFPDDHRYTQVETDPSICFHRYTNFSIVSQNSEEYKLVILISSYTLETQIKSICECFENENAAWQFVLVFYDDMNRSHFVRTSVFELNRSREFLEKIESKRIRNYQSTNTEIRQRKKILEKSKFSIARTSKKIFGKVKECVKRVINKTNPSIEAEEGYE